ncbi:hypothetical protein NECAME_05812 [Necator americanus]|uniref:Uncharacterized protein n=1 Tax=Necator americanus TaxID=51031 RepID=W2TXM9_NECAM|nr:hypothetical protein NECAME_05812 [Necator americanus]ETN86820.1 hypothetical protein NECAME_05812 [Necator americanus]
MHSSSAADGGHSSTQPKVVTAKVLPSQLSEKNFDFFQNRNTDEHYDNIARIVDQSITNANRILDTLGTKKENINKKARGKRGPVPESKCSLGSQKIMTWCPSVLVKEEGKNALAGSYWHTTFLLPPPKDSQIFMI